MNDNIKWAAQLHHVQEVSLAGVADLAYWQERLCPEKLSPRADQDGQAQLLVIAAAARFMGLAFREVSFSVVVEPPAGTERPDASFLVGAFNSRRFFAWCERSFFGTPYFHCEVREFATSPAAIHLLAPSNGEFRVSIGAESNVRPRMPSRIGDDGWLGPVYLPTQAHGKRAGKMFFAQLRGHTLAIPFLKESDSLTIAPTPNSNALGALVESNFTPQEWVVRTDAFHAKSKTYDRERHGP